VSPLATQAVLPQGLEQCRSLLRPLAEEDGGAQCSGPRSVAGTEERDERLAELGRAERLVGEQRQLPAVERLAEIAVFVGELKPLANLGRELAAERVQTRSLAPRLRGRD